MPLSPVIRFTTALLAFALAGTLLASDPAREQKIARLRLKEAELVSLLAQRQKAVPKSTPMPLPAVPSWKMPVGAIARLGNTRLRHAAPITCLTFSPDSRRILSGGQDGALYVWEAATGDAIRVLGLGYTPIAARFTHGGAHLTIAAGDSKLHVLHPESLHEESTFQAGSTSDFAISADGRFVAAIASNSLLTVSELKTGLPKLEVAIESSTGTAFAFHPNGKAIAVAQRTGKVTFFKLAGGKPILSFDHGGAVDGILFSRDGKRIATGGGMPTEIVKIWDLEAVRNGTIPMPVAQIAGASKPREWFGDHRIAAASRDGAGVYDLIKRRWVGFIGESIGKWAVSPDEKLIAIAGPGGLRIRVWDLASGKPVHTDNDSFPNAALLVPAADGRSLFALAGDGSFQWPIARSTAAPAGRLPGRAIVAASGGGRLAVATVNGVLVYDQFDPSKLLPAKPARRLTEFAAGPRSAAVSPNGKRIAYSGGDARIVIADAASGQTLRVLPTKTTALALSFSPDSTKLAVIGRDGFLRLWPLDARAAADGEDADLWRIRVQRAPHAAVAFSPDGKLVAATSATLLNVIDAATGEKTFDFDRRDFEDNVFQQIAFSPDSRLLISGSAGLTGAVQVFELATRSRVRRFTTGFGAISQLCVFPDGLRAASAGADEVLTVWDLSFRHDKSAPTIGELRGMGRPRCSGRGQRLSGRPHTGRWRRGCNADSGGGARRDYREREEDLAVGSRPRFGRIRRARGRNESDSRSGFLSTCRGSECRQSRGIGRGSRTCGRDRRQADGQGGDRSSARAGGRYSPPRSRCAGAGRYWRGGCEGPPCTGRETGRPRR